MARSETFVDASPGTVFAELVESRCHGEPIAAESLPPVRLRLLERAGPLRVLRVTVDLQPEFDGTRVSVVSDPVLPLGRFLVGPLGHAALRLRDRASLRSLDAGARARVRRAET